MTDLEYEGFVKMRKHYDLPVWPRDEVDSIEPPWTPSRLNRFREIALNGVEQAFADWPEDGS